MLGRNRAVPPAILGFVNRIAHEENFHPVIEYEKWYDIKSEIFTNYRVCDKDLIFLLLKHGVWNFSENSWHNFLGLPLKMVI